MIHMSWVVVCPKIVYVTLAESSVNLVKSCLFAYPFPDNLHCHQDLPPIFLSTLLLVFHIGVHPIKQKHLGLVFCLFDASLTICQLNDSVGFDFIGSDQGGLVLPARVFVRFGDDIQLQIFIGTFAIPIDIQVQTFVSVA